MKGRVEARRSTQISTQTFGLTVSYAERRERQVYREHDPDGAVTLERRFLVTRTRRSLTRP